MDSAIHVKNGQATAYVGPDATNLYRARMIRAAINLHKKCGMIPTRGVTITKLFKMVEGYTGKRYKRGEHDRAMADMDLWINTMLAALPIVEE